MAKSNPETGHAINIGRFKSIAERTDSLGALYNPPVTYLQQDQLWAAVGEGEARLTQVNDSVAQFLEKTNERRNLFHGMPLIATKIISYLGICGASGDTIKDALAINKKIRGKRAKPKKDPTTGKPGDPTAGDTAEGDVDGGDIKLDRKSISVSQRSYINLAEHFSKLVSIAKAVPGFVPNEPEFSLAGLEVYLENLKTMNFDLDKAASNLFDARYARNVLLYKARVGMYDMAINIKRYVRNITGHDDPRYLAISSIILTRPKKIR